MDVGRLSSRVSQSGFTGSRDGGGGECSCPNVGAMSCSTSSRSCLGESGRAVTKLEDVDGRESSLACAGNQGSGMKLGAMRAGLTASEREVLQVCGRASRMSATAI